MPSSPSTSKEKACKANIFGKGKPQDKDKPEIKALEKRIEEKLSKKNS